MLYTYKNEQLESVSLEKYHEENLKDQICIGVLELDEFKNYYDLLGITEFAVAKYLSNVKFFQSSVEVYDDFTLGMLNIIDVFSLMDTRKQVGFYFQKNLFLFIRNGGKSPGVLEETITEASDHLHKDLTMEKAICSVFDRLIVNGNEEIKFTEKMINALGKQLEKNTFTEEVSDEIFSLKNRIAIIKEFTIQLIEIGCAFENNENDLVSGENLRYFKHMISKTERLKEKAFMLDDSLINMKELINMNINNKLNNTMNVLTIVTIIFEPIGIIAGWYGMNFINMPELTWKYGYLYVIALNMAISLGILSYFKRKKML